MKNFRNILLMVLLVFVSSCKDQVQKDAILTRKVEERTPITKVDVIGILEAFNMAMISPNKQLLEDLCLEQLTYGHSSGLIQNRVQFIDDLINGPFDFKSVSSPELTIQISKETAVARFIFLAKAINDESPVDIRLGCIIVFQQQDNGKLKLLARQAYKLPDPDSNN